MNMGSGSGALSVPRFVLNRESARPEGLESQIFGSNFSGLVLWVYFFRVLNQNDVGRRVAAHKGQALAVERPLIRINFQRREAGKLMAASAFEILRPKVVLTLFANDVDDAFREFVGQKFQGDVAAEFEIFGFIDHAHAAASDFADDAVVRNNLPGRSGFRSHWEILRVEERRVNRGWSAVDGGGKMLMMHPFRRLPCFGRKGASAFVQSE
jgi:hypothetical protein